MGKPFTVNINRFDPYKSYRFLVYFGLDTTPVAAVSKVSALKRSSDVIEYKEGGTPIILKGLGRTKYEPITLERGVTYDSATSSRMGERRAGARQGRATPVAQEPAQGSAHRSAQRGGPAGPSLHRARLLGLRVPGAARPRRGGECHGDRAHQAREPWLGAGQVLTETAEI